MARALDVANFFIELANDDPDEGMTNLRVNKLVYFAQGWSYARLGRPLFDDEIQAWDYGPVVPEVYNTFKACGRERIHAASGKFSAEIFTAEETELLLDVAREYGQYATSHLVSITHCQGSPWRESYRKHFHAAIENENICQYFNTLPPLQAFELPDDDDYEGYRDPEDGLLILPEELNDD